MDAKAGILIVDDDSILRKTLSDTLTAVGYTPIASVTGKEALESVEEKVPAVAVIDLGLEDMSGLELMGKLKERFPSTECIVLTGYASQASAIEAVNLGAYSYLQKPYDIDQLLMTIRRAVEKRKSEEALRESEERYRTLFEGVPVGLYRSTPDGQILDINPALLEMMGFPDREAALAVNTADGYASPDDRARWQALMDREGVVRDFEVQWRQHGGATIWVQDSARVIRDAHGRVLYYEGAAEDLTERKQAEEKIGRLAKFPSENPNPVLRVAKDGTILYANEASLPLLSVWGCQVNQPLPDHWHEFTSDALSSGSSKDAEVECEDRILSLTFAPVVEADYVNVYGLDITERKRAEEALWESEEKYRTILDNIEDGYFEVDLAGNLTFFNASLCRMLGYSRDETMGMNNRQYMDKEGAKRVFREFNTVYTTGKPAKGFDWEIIRKDGAKRIIESPISLIKNSEGEAIGFRGIARDITERKRAEEALRESKLQLESRERFISSILDSIPTSLVVIDRTLRIVSANRNFLERSRREAHTTLDQKIEEVFPQVLLQYTRLDQKVREVFRTGEPVEGGRLAYRAPGLPTRIYYYRLIPLYLSSIPFSSREEGGVENVMLLMDDVTEREKLGEEVRRAERHLASVVDSAHDLVASMDAEGRILTWNSLPDTFYQARHLELHGNG